MSLNFPLALQNLMTAHFTFLVRFFCWLSKCSLGQIIWNLVTFFIDRMNIVSSKNISNKIQKYKQHDCKTLHDCNQGRAERGVGGMCVYVCVCVCVGGGWNLFVFLTKCVGKISRPNVVGKFGVFCYEKRNAEFYQYPVPQKSNFYRWWRLLAI